MDKPSARPPSLPPALLAEFAAIVGASHAIVDPVAMTAYLTEPRDRYHGRAAAVLRPGTVEEVQNILALAHRTLTGIVPQGGNTGLVGGQVPCGRGDEIVLSLERLDRIRNVDPVDDTVTVEAGVTLLRVQEAARKAGRLFPLSLASQGSCRIGGNLATNAGGVSVIAHGNARDLCLGLEVVLADGRLWNGLKRLRKDNAGYDLKHLFVGSEGTLGIITAAVMRLVPEPAATSTAWIAVAEPAAALRLLTLARRASGNLVTAVELVPRIGVEFTLRHGGTRDPFAEPHPWYVLLELAGAGEASALSAVMEAILAEAMEEGLVRDAVIAASEAQRASLWRIREALSEVQRREGGSIKHDVSVPVSRTPRFIAAASAAVIALIPGARVVAFGHVGDGNIHFNVSQPVGADTAAFLARWDEVNRAVHAIVRDLEGSISAEHGIGQMKRELLAEVKSPVEIELMRGLKRLLDPRGILNPGKLLPEERK
jgi:FAD/FMN-containing dehydrogenase